jgi:hypothetical protein
MGKMLAIMFILGKILNLQMEKMLAIMFILGKILNH